MKASRLVQTEVMAILFDGDEPPEDRTLNLKVNPGALTPAKEAALRAAEDEDAVGPMVSLVAEIVVEWDLMDDDGVVIPLTQDSLMNVPIIVLGKVLNGVSSELAKITQEEGKASAGT